MKESINLYLKNRTAIIFAVIALITFFGVGYAWVFGLSARASSGGDPQPPPPPPVIPDIVATISATPNPIYYGESVRLVWSGVPKDGVFSGTDAGCKPKSGPVKKCDFFGDGDNNDFDWPIWKPTGAEAIPRSTSPETCVTQYGLGTGYNPLSPQGTHRFEIECRDNDSFYNTAYVDVEVLPARIPHCEISVDPPTVLEGESATVTWKSIGIYENPAIYDFETEPHLTYPLNIDQVRSQGNEIRVESAVGGVGFPAGAKVLRVTPQGTSGGLPAKGDWFLEKVPRNATNLSIELQHNQWGPTGNNYRNPTLVVFTNHVMDQGYEIRWEGNNRVVVNRRNPAWPGNEYTRTELATSIGSGATVDGKFKVEVTVSGGNTRIREYHWNGITYGTPDLDVTDSSGLKFTRGGVGLSSIESDYYIDNISVSHNSQQTLANPYLFDECYATGLPWPAPPLPPISTHPGFIGYFNGLDDSSFYYGGSFLAENITASENTFGITCGSNLTSVSISPDVKRLSRILWGPPAMAVEELQFICRDSVSVAVNLCGNGTIEDGEECDGANLGGQTCISQGFTGGTLSCNTPEQCNFNTNLCTSVGVGACCNGTDDDGDFLPDELDPGCWLPGYNLFVCILNPDDPSCHSCTITNENNCGNFRCEPITGETPITCPADCKIIDIGEG